MAIPDLIYVLIKVFHYVIYCRGLVNFIAEQSIIARRWLYEGVIDDPYCEFFIAENKSLQKVFTMNNRNGSCLGFGLGGSMALY